ncbi:hypothetical protein N9B63_02845 [Akkermansiaceae bacterium]|nr:hypothetical protein [Akkermansiaceae bacterium]
MRARDQNHELNEERSVRNVGGNPRFLDRIFGLLEGPVATSLVKLLATGIISITIVAIVAILAFTSAPISLTLSAIGLGFLSVAIVWIFAKLSKTPNAVALINRKSLKSIEDKLSELEERLANVEVIERFEDRLASKASELSPDDDQSNAGTTSVSVRADSGN